MPAAGANSRHDYMNKLEKIYKSIRKNGLARTMSDVGRLATKKLSKLLKARRKRKFEAEALTSSNLEDRFTWIFKHNKWGDRESISGPGSTKKHTENLRKELPRLIEEHGIETLLDAPCGDFNWMKLIIDDLGIQYIGGDIVLPLIKRNQRKFGRSNIEFRQMDLVVDAFPPADILVCRDCLFHLSHRNIVQVLRNFAQSEIGLLLTTSYVAEPNERNRDIASGQFRPLDLCSAPYFFPEPVDRIADWIKPNRPRYMFLWSRRQISDAVNRLKDEWAEPAA